MARGEPPEELRGLVDKIRQLAVSVNEADLDALLKNKAELTKVLLYHVVAGKVMGADAMKMNGKMAKTVEGSSLNISVMGKVLEVNNAKVTKADIEASNGVIHVIDTVLMPKMMK